MGGGAVLLALIAMGTAIGLWRGSKAEEVARDQFAATQERGALPPSLHPRIDLGLCIGSGTCVEVCPEVDVLAVIDGKAELVNPTACIGHGECLRACPVDAITLVLGNAKRGVDIPMVASDFQTNVEGMYIVGELGGMGLIYNAMTQALQCVTALKKDLPAKVDGVHQLFIVGAGPAGIAASLSALEAKLDFVTVDQESLGGTVLHYPRH
jgi:ferredoxin